MEDNFWNKRYAEPEYAYGKEPNEYFKEVIDGLKPGKILLPGEGEGRNAVYAATKGWEVTAIDLSTEGKNKADKLAKESNVKIKYIVSSFEEYSFIENEYDAIALIFVHFNQNNRENTHRAIANSLKKGGVLLIEAFSKSQINNDSGGPKDISSLYSIEDIRQDFSEFTIECLSEHQVQLSEGPYHKGTADVIRLKAIK
ncbi:MAG: methyltransferase domain-containing protein [Ignavibacteriae bacterium]|nr:methyltransferase domain-containing protein [Ignavibacteriota bacterium]